MGELLEKAIKEKMLQDINTTAFYIHQHRNGQDIGKLVSDVKNLISEHNLPVSEAKGFLEYMKLVIDSNAYLPQEKQPQS